MSLNLSSIPLMHTSSAIRETICKRPGRSEIKSVQKINRPIWQSRNINNNLKTKWKLELVALFIPHLMREVQELLPRMVHLALTINT